MSLVTTMLSAIGGGGGGGGGGSVTGTIIAPVTAASTAALTATYANGSSGIGATLTNGSAYLTAARVATTAALTVTYSNGASGVGATLTNAGVQAALSIDSVTLSVNDRVLVKDQAAAAQNGVYSVTDVGSGSTNWVMTRVTDFDQAAEMLVGTDISVTAGTVNVGTVWILSATVTTVGTDPVSFVATAAFAIDGITLTSGQRVLIKNQTSALQNGVYSVSTVGSATANWVLTRTTDFDEPGEITVGTLVEVATGTVNGATLWEQTATVAAIGTDSITFTAMADAGYTASRALVTNASGRVVVATTTATEIGYVNGVTSAIQTQIDGKLAIGATDQTTTPVTLVVNTSYVANNAGLVTFNVPASVAQGSMFQVIGQGAGGWLIQMNTGQTANSPSGSTTSAGSLASTSRYDSVTILCTVANTTFTVTNTQGTITNA